MKIFIIFILIVIVLIVGGYAMSGEELHTSWLPEEWKKTIIIIEQKRLDDDGKGNTKEVFLPIGTGFLIYEDKAYLVTAKHIIYDKENKCLRKDIFFRTNKKDAHGTIRRPVDVIKQRFNVDWIFHQDSEIDLAVIVYGWDPDLDDIKTIPPDLFKKYDQVEEGSDIFFLGYPLGIVSEDRNNPLVRAGIISLKKEKVSFLIDANVYPGNSGSPVFLKPTIIDFKTKNIGKISPASLIGVISSYIPYVDPAYSKQTGRARITFEENSGLGLVYSIDCIEQIISQKQANNK